MAKTKVLILHTAVGFGIKATAENVFEQLSDSDQYDVRIEEFEKVESGVTTSAVKNSYLAIMEKFSGLWGFLYTSKLVNFISLPLRKIAASFKAKNVLKILREFQPAIVISTQTVPSGIMAYLKSKGLYRGKLVIVFSDYHLHRFWLYQEADLYLCNIADQVGELKALGVPEEKIKLTGTIIAKKFFTPLTREQACQEAGLLTTMPVVLMGGAGRARASVKDIFLQLLRSSKSFQVAVVCGHNEELKQELGRIAAPSNHPVKIFGYVNNMDQLMSAAAVMVYKTGGPSMAETVAKKLPLILTDIKPGHEEANLNYLLSNNIAAYARIPREAAFLVDQVLEGKLKFDFENSFSTILRPAGTISVVEAIDYINPEKGRKAAG